MSNVVLSYPIFNEGDTASGLQVTQNFNDIKDVVNGQIDDDNIANGGITGSSKLAASSVTATEIASANIRHAHIDWTSANNGVAAWRHNGYAGANGNRLIRVEKTITLAAVTTQQSFTINWSAGDSPDGNVTFSAEPTLVGLDILDASALITATDPDTVAFMKFSARTTTGCTVKITFSNAPTAGDVVLMFLAAGPA